MAKRCHGKGGKSTNGRRFDEFLDNGRDQPWVKPNPRMTLNTSGKQIGFNRRKGLVVGGREDYDEDDIHDRYEYGSYPDDE